jgi:hypothetical protein
MKKSELRKLIREVIKEQSNVKGNDMSLRKIQQIIDSQGDPKMSKFWKDFLNWLAQRHWI